MPKRCNLRPGVAMAEQMMGNRAAGCPIGRKIALSTKNSLYLAMMSITCCASSGLRPLPFSRPPPYSPSVYNSTISFFSPSS